MNVLFASQQVKPNFVFLSQNGGPIHPSQEPNLLVWNEAIEQNWNHHTFNMIITRRHIYISLKSDDITVVNLFCINHRSWVWSESVLIQRTLTHQNCHRCQPCLQIVQIRRKQKSSGTRSSVEWNAGHIWRTRTSIWCTTATRVVSWPMKASLARLWCSTNKEFFASYWNMAQTWTSCRREWVESRVVMNMETHCFI